MEVNCMLEKPSRELAEERMAVAMKNGDKTYYMVFGNYILTSEVFEQLEENIREGRKSRGEFQLTDALDAIREKSGMIAYRIDGEAFDIGNPEAYRNTVAKFGL